MMPKYECVLLGRYGQIVGRRTLDASTEQEASTWGYYWALCSGHYGEFEIRRNGRRIDAFRPAGTSLH
jgi:hypothetical protein